MVVYICAYVLPMGSPDHSMFEVETGIELLEGCLLDVLLSLDDVRVILCGDLNARSSNRFPDTSGINKYENISCGHEETKPRSRCFEDMTLNSYGKQLLKMCVALDLCIVNGVCNGDVEGCYTHLSDTGNSVNDYFYN